MRIFYCTDHEGHWPVPVASIVVARDEEDAFALLAGALAMHGLAQIARVTFKEVDPTVMQAIVLSAGDY